MDRRDRETRARRWEKLDDDLVFDAADLDRDVVAPDQIRTVIRAFRDRLPEMFPGRKDVPKTLIYAKDDSHADERLLTPPAPENPTSAARRKKSAPCGRSSSRG